MKNFRYIFALFFLFNFDGVIAADIDLELTSDIDFVDVEFGQVGEFSLSVTNHGPDTAGVSSPSSRVKAVANFLVLGGQLPDVDIYKDNSVTQPCHFGYFYGDPMPSGYSSVYVTFYFYDIPAGTTKTCYGKFEIKFKRGVRKVDWEAESLDDNEINPGNEAAQQVFSIAQAVPAIGFYALLTLLLATLLLARFRLSRENLR